MIADTSTTSSTQGPVDAAWITSLMEDLYPLNRSITGDGTRATLARIAREVDLTVEEVPSGTKVLDWEVPDEWNLGSARVENSHGIVVDTADTNLHLVAYSEPTRTEVNLTDLLHRLHSIPEQPDLVPYRTSYYTRSWGFCMPHDQLVMLEPDRYFIDIETSLEPGSLSYGEYFLPGRRRDEVLISTHICHPSLANDNLTGIAASAALAKWATAEPREYSYRFLFLPATIGSVTWLSRNLDELEWVRHGLVLTGLGDPGPLTYKQSRQRDAPIDRLMSHLVGRESGASLDWSPYGYDERQYCSPGFDLPIGRLSRTPHGEYVQYHTSADDLSFVQPDQVLSSISLAVSAFDAIESGLLPRNLAPYGEPQLGRRGLFRSVGGSTLQGRPEHTFLWILSLADGNTDLIEIAERSGIPLEQLIEAGAELRRVGLLV